MKRLALVIADADYVHTPTLKNPPNDAILISDKLRELGFESPRKGTFLADQSSEFLADEAAR